MPLDPLLASLSDSDRAAMEILLIDFEKNWTQDRLARVAESVSGPPRLATLAECLRIDREKDPSRDLDFYLAHFPEIQDELVGLHRNSDQPSQAQPASLTFGPNARYRIETEVGRGSSGIVYRAADTPTSADVAIKIFAKPPESAAVAPVPPCHPNICRPTDVRLDHDPPYVAMPYVAGLPLPRWREGRDVTAEDAVALVVELADAVHFAHRRGVRHGAIKAGSVIVTPAGEPILTDFCGLSQDAAADGDQAGLGAILFFLLTGRQPHPEGLSHIDPKLAAICRRAMADRRADQFRSVGRFASALRDFVNPRRRGMRIAAAVITLFAIGAIIAGSAAVFFAR